MSTRRRLGSAMRGTPLLKGLPREVAVLSAVAFCVALGFGILAPALPVFAREFGVSALQASAVISVFALVRFITSPFAGALVDRLGERTVLATGLLIVSASSFAAGFSQTYGQLLVLRGIGGLGSSMFTVSSMALLLRVVDSDQRGRAAGAFQGGFLLGGVAGPAVGGLVVAWSIRAPFFVYAFTLLAAAAVALIFMARSRLHEREELVSHGEANKLEQLRVALRDRAYQAALGTNLVSGFVVFGMRSAAVPLFVTEGMDRGASLTGIGFLVAAGYPGRPAAARPAAWPTPRAAARPCSSAPSALTVGMVVLTVTDVAINGLGTQAVAGNGLVPARHGDPGGRLGLPGLGPGGRRRRHHGRSQGRHRRGDLPDDVRFGGSCRALGGRFPHGFARFRLGVRGGCGAQRGSGYLGSPDARDAAPAAHD